MLLHKRGDDFVKCIYCNTEKNLTESDIIPWALTGAKVRKRFVCHTHNALTNDSFEKTMISNLAIFRNFLGLTERDWDPVRFCTDLKIRNYTIKKATISDRNSILKKDRVFSTTKENGRKVYIGGKSRLLEMPGATPEKIKEVCFSDISLLLTKLNVRKLFISQEALHTVAKIAYEWHCLINEIEGYHEKKYREIVSYILSPDSRNAFVQIVTDPVFWRGMECLCRSGTNMLFEYSDTDGNVYVIFGFWGVILYKIRVCAADEVARSHITSYDVHLYHIDGTKNVLRTEGDKVVEALNVYAEAPESGMLRYSTRIEERLSRIIDSKSRSLSREYLQKEVKKLERILPAYKAGKISGPEVLAFGDEDRLLTICVLEVLYLHRKEYTEEVSFNQNLKRIIQADGRIALTQEMREETVQRYVDMDKNGTLLDMLWTAIAFFNLRVKKD